MSADPKIDPEAFADAEIIKDMLETVISSQQRIEGRLESIATELGWPTKSKEKGRDPCQTEHT